MYFAIITEDKDIVTKINYNGTRERAIENLYGTYINYATARTLKSAQKKVKEMRLEYDSI